VITGKENSISIGFETTALTTLRQGQSASLHCSSQFTLNVALYRLSADHCGMATLVKGIAALLIRPEYLVNGELRLNSRGKEH